MSCCENCMALTQHGIVRPSPEVKAYDELIGRNKSKNTTIHRKRKARDTFACRSCRQRKVRCDGTRPVCRTCGRRDISCSYLEESSAVPYRAGQQTNDDVQWRESAENHNDASYRGNVVNAMGVLTAQSQPAEREAQFFGESSIASLLQGIQASSISSTAANKNPELGNQAHAEWSEPARRLLGTVSRFEFENYLLPPKQLADHLLSCYWNEVHVLYPFIHKVTFLQTYSCLWTADHTPPATESHMGLGDTTSSPVVFHFALNAMFALGCQFSPLAGEDRESKSEVFLQRSNSLLRQIDLLDHGDLSLVQALLLNAHYLQSTPFADRCWNAIGLACRMAQGIGLHSTDHDSRWSHAELQIRRCVWHSCVMIEMSASMALGRPSMIAGHISVPFPEAVEDTFTGSLDPRVDSFFTYNMKLFYIMGGILNRIYQPRRLNGEVPLGTFNTISDTMRATESLDHELFSFASSLPSYLQWHTDRRQVPDNRQLHRQMNVLHARYLHLKVLLYRPMLTRLCRVGRNYRQAIHDCDAMPGNPDSTAESEIQLDYSRRCVDAAIELAHVLEDKDQACLPAWWYTVLYAFTSGVVLVLAQLCPEMIEQFTIDTLTTGWKHCLNFLERKTTHNSSATKCALDLRKAYQLVATQRQAALDAATQQSDSQAPSQPNVVGVDPVDWSYGTGSAVWPDNFLTDLLWDDIITTVPLYF